jgi:hypothetical protein
MKLSGLAKYALTFTMGAAMLAACSNNGGSVLAPSGTSIGMPSFTHIGRAIIVNGVLITAAHPNLSTHIVVRSQPTKTKGSGLYQYISNFNPLRSSVFEFDYPKGNVAIRAIMRVSAPQGECTMNGMKTFWVTESGSNEVEEFAVGGKRPILTLRESTGEPSSCAIDPASGDLAATIISNGDVIVYKNGSKKGTVITTPLTKAFFDGYDNGGNLFADGFNSSDAFALVELPKGSRTFETIATSNTVLFPGGVQWDGKYVAVNDQEAHAIYRYRVSGTTAALKGTVSLSSSSDCVQTWIAKAVVFCPDSGNNDGEVYKYPAGGSPIATLTGYFNMPIGAVQAAK